LAHGVPFPDIGHRARVTRELDRRGGKVRKLMTLTLASAAIVVVACGRTKAPTTSAMSDDLKKDLQLASQTQNIQINPDEIAPQSHKELALRPKKAPSGPKVIRSEHPTVKASATPKEVAQIKTDIPQVEVMASSPAPSETPTPDSPPLARPAPVPAPTYPSTGPIQGPGQGSSGGGIGSVLGGIFGGVIMGGDDDHCDPRGGRRRGGGVYGPVYGGGINIPIPGGRRGGYPRGGFPLVSTRP
jgi:hypothetical protein